MSTPIAINKAINPARLDVELRAAVPALFGLAGDLPVAHYSLSELGPDQWLMEVPDDADVPAITAVVAAHNPAIRTTLQAQEDADTLSLQVLRDQYQLLKAGVDTIRVHQALVRTHMDAIQATANPTVANLASLQAVVNAVKQLSQDVEQTSDDMTTLCNGLDRLLDVLAILVRQVRA